MREAFNFYRSYFDVLEELNDRDKLLFLKALLDKQFNGNDPVGLKGMAKFAYISQKHSIDKQVVGYERAKNVVLSEISKPSGSPIPSPPKEVQVQGEVEGEVKRKGKAAEVFIFWFNGLIKKHKGSGKFKLTSKVEKQFNARLKEGYTQVDFLNAFNSITRDKFHIEKQFQYLTPEFITRADQLNKWSNVTPIKLEEEKGKGSGGLSMEEMYNQTA